MKDLAELSKCLENMGSVLEKYLIEAQDEAADIMYDEVIQTARVDTGVYRDSIYRTPTEVVGNDIQTFIGSDLQVVNSMGDSYNLGELLEHGTAPHLIEPANKEYLHFKTKDGKWVRTKLVHHPGTVAYNTYAMAKYNHTLEYEQLLASAVEKAFEEGFK